MINNALCVCITWRDRVHISNLLCDSILGISHDNTNQVMCWVISLRTAMWYYFISSEKNHHDYLPRVLLNIQLIMIVRLTHRHYQSSSSSVRILTTTVAFFDNSALLLNQTNNCLIMISSCLHVFLWLYYPILVVISTPSSYAQRVCSVKHKHDSYS